MVEAGDMARKLRIQFEGAIYHVTLRGVDRREIFVNPEDCERFVCRMSDAVGEYGVRLYLFCLMRNHAHLLVETPRGNLSAFMHKLQTAYTVYYNLRHRRVGHLMQGRYGAKPVEGDEYLLKLSRYIHLNPVFTRSLKDRPLEARVKELRAYPWSSYRGYAGFSKPFAMMDEEPVLAMMEASGNRRRRAYRRYVEEGLVQTDDRFQGVMKESLWGIGGAEFQAEMRDRHHDAARRVKRTEDVSFRRAEAIASPDTVLKAVGAEFGLSVGDLRVRGYGCVARGVAALMLRKYSGMNQRDVAGYLGMGTGSAVCRQLMRLREHCARERAVGQRVSRVESNVRKEL